MDKENLEKLTKTLIGVSHTTEKLFLNLTPYYLESLDNLRMIEMSYDLGGFAQLMDSCKQHANKLPDYEQTMSKLEIIKKRLYNEAERRDRGF